MSNFLKLLIVFILALSIVSVGCSAIVIDPDDPFVPPEKESPIKISAKYQNGQIVVKYTNPSYPDVKTNYYVYIPERFRDNPTVSISFGNGFKEKGTPKIYQDWVGDRLEESINETYKWAKRINALVSIGSSNSADAIAMANGKENEKNTILAIYKGLSHKYRYESSSLFQKSLYKLNLP